MAVEKILQIYASCTSYCYGYFMDASNSQIAETHLGFSAKDVFSELDQLRTGIAFYSADFRLVFANKQIRSYLPNLYAKLDAGGTLIQGIEHQIEAIFPTLAFKERKTRAAYIFNKVQNAENMELDTPAGIRLKSFYSRMDNGSYILTTTDVTDHIERAEELAQARADADAANTAKSKFLANMSHEIRTPMSGVLMAAQLLRQQLVSLNHPELTDLADILVGSAKYLNGIISDILTMSKIEAEQVDVMLQDASLADNLSVLVKSQEFVAREAGLDLKLVLDPRLPERLFFDALHVQQCVMNLVSNALKFTTVGSVTIAALYNPQSCVVTIHVVDTGIGIATDERHCVFDQFGQASSAKNPTIAGTGLGLTISRNLARLMGGDIKLTSEVGKGSIFSFTFISEPSVRLSEPKEEAA